jgi:RimJ/RimL family protein N-acetyltransferase
MRFANARVKLRPIALADAPRYVKWFADPEVTKNLRQQRITLAQQRAWIRGAKKRPANKVFAIETRGGTHIGSIGLHKVSKQDCKAEYGIFIGDKSFWGQGYGRAASELILMYGFRVLKLNRIYLQVYVFNTRGLRLYAKLGFKKEGVLRQHVRRGGRYHNAVVMGLLASEWKKR